MTETNDWISPWWGSHWHRPDAAAEGKGFFSKPILLLWSMALGMEVWGWTELSIRFGVAIMAILGVVFVYLAGTSVWNRRVGALMAMVMATTPFYFFVGRQAQTDMPFVSMLVCAMALFIMGAYGRDRRKPADVVHYGLFFGALLILVIPQLWLIGTDEGFSESQRAMRPGLRPNSMLDFKAEDVLETIVEADTPHLSPAERDALAELEPAEAQARIDAATGDGGDWTGEMWAPYTATAIGLAGLVALFFFGLRGRLKARVLHEKDNRISVLVLIGLALLAQAMALWQHVNRLREAWGMNWEPHGTAFNLVKFSGIALSVVLLLTTVAFGWACWRMWRVADDVAASRSDDDDDSADIDSDRFGAVGRRNVWRWLSFGTTALVVATLFVSPIFLVMKGKALGVDGLSFWDAEVFPAVRIAKIVLGSVYAPLLLGLFLFLGALIFFSARSTFWKKRNALGLWAVAILVCSLFFLCVSVFYIPITLDGKLATFGKVAGKVISSVFQWGPVQIVIYVGCMVVVAVSLATSKRKTVGQLCFMGFYIFAALATMAKGLLGFALPGAIIMFYLISTAEWKRLLEFEVPRGILVFISVGVPWSASMLILHERAYFMRFFVHDHFKRLASGVHAIDDGTFEHFIKWLGYGLYPWVALVPLALIRLGAGRGLLARDDRSRATLLIAIWATFAFALFSLSSTKFHHYTFPVIPPLCMLVALFLAEIWDGRMKRIGALLVGGGAVLALVGWDLYVDPQHWKNLFTYKYDRQWIDMVPEFTANIFGIPTRLTGTELHDSFKAWALNVGVIAAIGLALMMVRVRVVRRLGVVTIMASAIGLTVWGLNVYMPGISPTWSQRGMWMAYWDECTKTEAPANADEKKIWCEESSLVNRITWRGEHYYSQNESIPVQSDDDLAYFASYNGDTPFYIMVDRPRYCGGSEKMPNFGPSCTGKGAIIGEVKKHYPNKPVEAELTWDENLKFVIVKFYPAGKPDDEDGAATGAGRKGTEAQKSPKNEVKPQPDRSRTSPGATQPTTRPVPTPSAQPRPAGRIGPNGIRRPGGTVVPRRPDVDREPLDDTKVEPSAIPAPPTEATGKSPAGSAEPAEPAAGGEPATAQPPTGEPPTGAPSSE